MKTDAVNHTSLVAFRSLLKYTKKHKGTIQNSLSPGLCLLQILKSCCSQLSQRMDVMSLFGCVCVCIVLGSPRGDDERFKSAQMS